MNNGEKNLNLLGADEPQPVGQLRLGGTSPYFLTCDHAGQRVPHRLSGLGLPAHERSRHIGWDIGALDVAKEMSARLDAALLWQNYSRLVIDCNRKLQAEDSIPRSSEYTVIPGNHELSADDVTARQREIFIPYRDAITAALDARAVAGRPTVLVSIHSFTPRYRGIRRPWELSLMFDRRPQLTRLLTAILDDDVDGQELCIGVNEPYQVEPDSDHGVPVHGDDRGLVNVQFEIRQDLLNDGAARACWGERLAAWLGRAEAQIDYAEDDV